jgi:hypothetical protein
LSKRSADLALGGSGRVPAPAENARPGEPAVAPTETAAGGGHVFRCLEAILAEQLDRARRGDLVAVGDLGRRADTLVRAARARGLKADALARQRLAGLYDALALTLAQQADEIGRKRARLRQGKTTLRAYRHGL